MRCLHEVELQAVADGEAAGASGANAWAAHVAECARCHERVESIRRDLRDVAAVLETAGEIPPRLEARVREAITLQEPIRGSTRLREPVEVPAWRRPRIVLPLAAAALVTLIVSGVLPRFGAPPTLSASQVLSRSLETLASAQGVEVLEYELVSDGLANGSWRIHLVVDHDRPTRYRVTTLAADGEVVAAMSQDPVRQRRTQLVRVDGRNYVVNVAPVSNPMLSLPQMAQALAETTITMMQATTDPKLTVVDGPQGRRQYVVEMPPVTPTTTAATLDLHRARAVVSATDFRIREFEASGTLLKQPFAISFKLLQHLVLSGNVQMTPDPFELLPGPGDVVLEGVAAEHPFEELLTTLARELARARAF